MTESDLRKQIESGNSNRNQFSLPILYYSKAEMYREIGDFVCLKMSFQLIPPEDIINSNFLSNFYEIFTQLEHCLPAPPKVMSWDGCWADISKDYQLH